MTAPEVLLMVKAVVVGVALGFSFGAVRRSLNR